jgi:hypothetical protein
VVRDSGRRFDGIKASGGWRRRGGGKPRDPQPAIYNSTAIRRILVARPLNAPGMIHAFRAKPLANARLAVRIVGSEAARRPYRSITKKSGEKCNAAA